MEAKPCRTIKELAHVGQTEETRQPSKRKHFENYRIDRVWFLKMPTRYTRRGESTPSVLNVLDQSHFAVHLKLTQRCK